ncbi:hypothetical protein [Amycolatopsis sp. lyj-112]|uniref:hypothetical protein n=1 Tax=Amycolatopsis sp. lyj-112 TaxID=2789288 RepID=UPI003978BF5D
MSELLYSRVTEDKSEIILEDREGTELGRYPNADELHKDAKEKYGSFMLIPREEQQK